MGGPPLARGSPSFRVGVVGAPGWTPARAGEPNRRSRMPCGSEVDPRSRGGAFYIASHRCQLSGGPPLARGSPRRMCWCSPIPGWTPARAGEPFVSAGSGCGSGVDPRSRGGALPRGLGGVEVGGGPPLARGSLGGELIHEGVRRWTPARAGEPRAPRVARVPLQVDPRSRGGAITSRSMSSSFEGGPPLARGSPPSSGRPPMSSRWTPARAGEPRSR
mgnify:CR=1 FL=1